MALFSKDTKEEKKSSKSTTSQSDAAPVSIEKGKHIIQGAHITEKAAVLSDTNVYAFDVHPDANKVEIARAVKERYGVEPRKVHVVRKQTKRVFRRKGVGTKGGGKKAYVYLKKGDTIELF